MKFAKTATTKAGLKLTQHMYKNVFPVIVPQKINQKNTQLLLIGRAFLSGYFLLEHIFF